MINRQVDYPSAVHTKDCVDHDAESSIQEEEKKESHSPGAKLAVLEQDVVGGRLRVA
jgi:hypothetical protein